MHYFLKSLIQNAIACLPNGLGDGLYFRAQQLSRSFSSGNAHRHFSPARDILRALESVGRTPIGEWLEVGTGRTLNVPIALWLCGATRVTTADKNALLREDVALRSVRWICDHHEEWRGLLDGFLAPDAIDRLQALRVVKSLDELFEATGIRYLAPCDAGRLSLASGTFDYHYSVSVLEHIAPEVVLSILEEGRRVVKEKGLLIHIVDLSDHFSHSDSTLSSVNFLRFGERTWKLLAGNRFMYQNRLRSSQVEKLFAHAKLELVRKELWVDRDAERSILNGDFKTNHMFDVMPAEDLATRRIDLLARPHRPSAAV